MARGKDVASRACTLMSAVECTSICQVCMTVLPGRSAAMHVRVNPGEIWGPAACLPSALGPGVQDLFSPFGQISRIYVAYDRDTGENRGFAFVNFVHR